MTRTETEIIRDAARAGRHDAQNVADGRDGLGEFFGGDIKLALSLARSELATRIARTLKREAGFYESHAEGIRRNLDPGERVSAAAARKAADAWAEAWAGVAADRIADYARERKKAMGDDDDWRANPATETRYTLHLGTGRDRSALPLTVAREEKRRGKWVPVRAVKLRYDGADGTVYGRAPRWWVKLGAGFTPALRRQLLQTAHEAFADRYER